MATRSSAFDPLTCDVVHSDDEEPCLALRAAEYARWYRNVPRGRFSDEFDRATLDDGRRASRLLAVKDRGELVGTCRLLLARHPAHPELRSEIADLVAFTWPEVARTAGLSPSGLAVAELGKFAVARGADARRVKWMMLRAAGGLASQWGAQLVLALMTPHVERAARHSGVRFRRLEAARLRRDGAHRRKFLLLYQDYFLPSLRKLGLEIDPGRLDPAGPLALEMLTEGLPDGPSLWWIAAHELASSHDPGPSGGKPAC